MRKRSKKRSTSHKRKPTGWQKCKYVGKRGSRTVANRLANELKRDCYRPLVQEPRMPHEGYTVLSCGKLPACPKKRKRRKSKR